MRVFVVGTGRCGSVTFHHACAHIVNYTSGHEDVFKKADKLDWPDQHIAVEPSIWPMIPLLRTHYPDLVLVHLIREDREAFVPSYRSLDSAEFIGAQKYRLPPEKRPVGHENWEGAPPIIDVWAALRIGAPINERERLTMINLFYDACNEAIRSFGPSLTVRLEKAKEDWPAFWELIGAEGDYAASRDTWNVKYNTRESRS